MAVRVGRSGVESVVVGVAAAVTLLAGVAAAATVAPAPVAPSVLAAPVQARPEPLPLPAVTPLPATPPPAPLPMPAAPAPVAPFVGLQVPDLLVTLPASLTPEQVAALQAVEGVSGLAVLDAGTVELAGTAAQVVGVDPSQFRSFTPLETAQSDELWQAVARGDLAPTHGRAEAGDLPLGGEVAVGSAGSQRVGAVASYGLPGVDAVVDRSETAAYGLVPSSAAVLSAPERGVEALEDAVRQVVGEGASVTVLRPQPVVVVPQGKATTYRDLYIQGAQRCPGLRWQVLAAIGQVESGHGQNNGPSSAGALGPMQFLPLTWESFGVDGDGDGVASIDNPYDAIPAAAGYLCRYGGGNGGQDLYDAIFAYNHLDSYVQKVLALSEQYV